MIVDAMGRKGEPSVQTIALPLCGNSSQRESPGKLIDKLRHCCTVFVFMCSELELRNEINFHVSWVERQAGGYESQLAMR
ncbi:hypothetical protein E2C01_057870 [Portunus trituberculatus]|uniref:Uncharacterized protein n=1 Tax=Portunus trituberculatus TaxID=210409 RepID=A0A5B7H355_PORTR|nr:hypothetical protein [Portunus trituberculatus]